MTDAGQQVLDRRAALERMERGQLPECAVCSCPWKRHLSRSGVGQCGCGCPRYRDAPVEPELAPEDPRLWTSAERRQARQARRENATDDYIRRKYQETDQ